MAATAKKPEELARVRIDAALHASGWVVQDHDEMNVHDGQRCRGQGLPDDHRKFTDLYAVQRLQGNTIANSTKVVITTVQRLYSMLKGEPEFDPDAEDEELTKERHHKASMILTSNRDPGEWVRMMSEPLLAQSAVDRFVNAAHDLILEGPSYRENQKPGRKSAGP
ncbi:MAG: hypothetical protein EXR79_08845 [Myxococcales bacterium]|nr:hypothetical protein [Myxococcales bacterium]